MPTKARQRPRRQHDGRQAKLEKPVKVHSTVQEEKGQSPCNVFGVLFVFLLAVLVGLLGIGYYRSPIKVLEIADIAPVIQLERNSRLTKGEM